MMLMLLMGCSEDLLRRADRGPAALDLAAHLERAVTDHGGELPIHDASPVDLPPGAPDARPADSAPPPPQEMLLVDKKNLQFVTKDNGFLALVKPGDPLAVKNWLTPVDYYNGEFQIRYVISAPTNQKAGQLQTCIWTIGNADGDGKDYFPESCSAQVPHSGVGTITNTKLVPASWWKKDGVPLDYSHPERFLVRAVLRGSSGCVVTTYPVPGACWNEWASFQAMIFRVTIVMVPKGKTFSGWAAYP